MEKLKEKLKEIKQFNPRDAYKRINRLEEKGLNEFDFTDFLKDNSIRHIKAEHAKLLIYKYDKDKDGVLNLQEFFNMLGMNHFETTSYNQNRNIVIPHSAPHE